MTINQTIENLISGLAYQVSNNKSFIFNAAQSVAKTMQISRASMNSVDLTKKAFLLQDSVMKINHSICMQHEELLKSTKQIASIQDENIRRISQISKNWLSISSEILDYFRHLGGPNYPVNMKEGLGGEYDKEWLTKVLYDEGIPLYAVPNPKIIQRLRNSKIGPTHRSILGRELPNIIKDCNALICPQSRNTKERSISKLIEQSIIVISDGHLAAGDALLSSVLDFLINNRLTKDEGLHVSPPRTGLKEIEGLHNTDKSQIRKDGKPIRSFVEVYRELPKRIALFPLLSAYRYMYEKARGPYIEIGYSRHAIAHRPTVKLFTKANTAQALLCVTSLAAYIYKW